MTTTIKKVMNSCNISEKEAEREISAANDILLADEDINMTALDDYCQDLGIDLDDIMSNPEMLLI